MVQVLSPTNPRSVKNVVRVRFQNLIHYARIIDARLAATRVGSYGYLHVLGRNGACIKDFVLAFDRPPSRGERPTTVLGDSSRGASEIPSKTLPAGQSPTE